MNTIVSAKFGKLTISGCNDHPDRMDLTCTRIRQADGTPLTMLQVWELIEELSTDNSASALDKPNPGETS